MPRFNQGERGRYLPLQAIDRKNETGAGRREHLCPPVLKKDISEMSFNGRRVDDGKAVPVSQSVLFQFMNDLGEEEMRAVVYKVKLAALSNRF